jgi:hypothetical protein
MITGKVAPEIMGRIRMLGEMNERHIRALGSQDKQVLKELAAEYDAICCPHKAQVIRTQARAIRKRRSRTAEASTQITVTP